MPPRQLGLRGLFAGKKEVIEQEEPEKRPVGRPKKQKVEGDEEHVEKRPVGRPKTQAKISEKIHEDMHKLFVESGLSECAKNMMSTASQESLQKKVKIGKLEALRDSLSSLVRKFKSDGNQRHDGEGEALEDEFCSILPVANEDEALPLADQDGVLLSAMSPEEGARHGEAAGVMGREHGRLGGRPKKHESVVAAEEYLHLTSAEHYSLSVPERDDSFGPQAKLQFCKVFRKAQEQHPMRVRTTC